MLIRTKREWKMIYDAVHTRFVHITTDLQKEMFGKECFKKFPGGAATNPYTADELQTAVHLMLDFAYNNDLSIGGAD